MFQRFILVVLFFGMIGSAVWLEANAQEIEVFFSDRTVLDNPGIHVEPLLGEPAEQLILPEVDTTGAQFLSIYYTRDYSGDTQVSVMAIPNRRGSSTFFNAITFSPAAINFVKSTLAIVSLKIIIIGPGPIC